LIFKKKGKSYFVNNNKKGIQLEISGSTMLALSHQVGTNLSELAWIVAARSFGYIITVVLFVIIFQSITKNHSELMLTIAFLIPAAGQLFLLK
jgi:hypothetical protein